MKKVMSSMAVALALIFNLNATALAVPTNESLQQRKAELTRMQASREEIEMKIEGFDNEIGKIMAKTEENKVKISETEKAIESASVQIKKVETEAQAEQELFNSRMRSMYINGFDGYMMTILNSESFGDFISRVESVKAIIEFDKKVVSEFQALQKELSKNQKTLNKTKVTLHNLQVRNKQELDMIIVTKESQNKLINDLKSKENLLAGQISESQLARQISESQLLVSKSITKIDEIKKAVPKVKPSRGSSAVSANAVIAYGATFLGTPYLWGGTSPSTGFDCSGFTQYVYRHFGINVGRTTYNQIKDGVQVSKNNLMPGDLVFFGKNNSPTHMGIYVGDNNYMHSPRTGDVLKISPMTRRDYITARRVM